jgi:hypothetical protein
MPPRWLRRGGFSDCPIDTPVSGRPYAEMKEKEPIHRWDGYVLLKALLIGLALETTAFLPGVLSPWGHAGPESLLGWVSLLLHLPGLCLLWFFTKASGIEQPSAMTYMVFTYSIQALGITYIAFVYLRWKKRRTRGP